MLHRCTANYSILCKLQYLITIPVSIAAVGFNAEFYVKLEIFFQELGFLFSELLKIDFSESPVGATPAMFMKSCIIFLLCKEHIQR